MQNLRALGAPLPNPRASGGWVFAPKPPNQLPHCEFLATRLNMVNKRNYPSIVLFFNNNS